MVLGDQWQFFLWSKIIFKNWSKTFSRAELDLSTAEDYFAKFFQIVFWNGGFLIERFKPPHWKSKMLTKSGDLVAGWDRKSYGTRFWVVNWTWLSKGGWGSVGHFDWGGYFNTQLFCRSCDFHLGSDGSKPKVKRRSGDWMENLGRWFCGQ